jgi:hypothetical protein
MDNSKVDATYLAKGLEFVGMGVNIFDESYLLPPSNGRVIDTNDGNVTRTPIRQTNAVETFGSNFAEFIQDFSVSAGLDGSYKGFTASVETKFARSSRESVEIKFAQLSLISSGEILSLSGNLKHCLNKHFKEALQADDPKKLFAAYGTHVATKVKIGGMISYYSYSKATERQSTSEFEFAARAKYKGYGAEVGANGSLTEKEKEAAKTVEGSEHLFVNGGGEVERIKVEKGDKGSYADWAATIAASPGFIGFAPNGLLPVWELTDDPVRAAALELAFRQEAARQIQILIFSHTGEVAAHPHARVHIPKDYKLLGGGARENYAGEGNLLTASFPDGDTTWSARGKDHYYHNSASISAFAIGIYDNPKLDLWEVAQFTATGFQAARPSAQVALAADFVAKGGVLVGGGAIVVYGTGAGVLLTSSYPKDATTWAANAADPLNSGPATITVFAQGLRCKVEGVKIAVDINHVRSQSKNHPSESCSTKRGFALTGGGAFVDYGTGPGNLLTKSYPENDHTWTASSKDHKEHSPATITAYAIGLKVT